MHRLALLLCWLALAAFASLYFPLPSSSSSSSSSSSLNTSSSSLLNTSSSSPAPFARAVVVVVDALRAGAALGSARAMPRTAALVDARAAVAGRADAQAPTVTLPRIKGKRAQKAQGEG